MDCIFCKIIQNKLPATIIYHDDKVVAFDDIYPKAPQHKIIIPKKHIATINDLQEEDKDLVGHMVYVAQQLAKKVGTKKSYISRLENGRCDIQLSTLYRIFEFGLGKKINILIG